jgi:hypothetical protein
MLEAGRDEADHIDVLGKFRSGERRGLVGHGEHALDRRHLLQLDDLRVAEIDRIVWACFACYGETDDAAGRGVRIGV